MKETNIY